MTRRLIDVAIQSLITLTIAEMPDILTEIESDYADGIVLRDPRMVVDFKPDDFEIPDTPIICVLPGRTRFLTDTGFGQGGFADAQHEIFMAAILEDSSPRILAKRLIRYQRAMMELVGAHRVGVLAADGTTAWGGLSILGTQPGERFRPGANPSQYGDSTTIMLRVTRTEA